VSHISLAHPDKTAPHQAKILALIPSRNQGNSSTSPNEHKKRSNEFHISNFNVGDIKSSPYTLQSQVQRIYKPYTRNAINMANKQKQSLMKSLLNKKLDLGVGTDYAFKTTHEDEFRWLQPKEIMN
jgi:hypothetical protein